MRNYFVNMVFGDITAELIRIDNEDQELENLGQKIMIITCLIVCPTKLDGNLQKVDQVTNEHLSKANEIMNSEEFNEQFKDLCSMDTIPDITLAHIKLVKAEFIDVLITGNQEMI